MCNLEADLERVLGVVEAVCRVMRLGVVITNRDRFDGESSARDRFRLGLVGARWIGDGEIGDSAIGRAGVGDGR